MWRRRFKTRVPLCICRPSRQGFLCCFRSDVQQRKTDADITSRIDVPSARGHETAREHWEGIMLRMIEDGDVAKYTIRTATQLVQTSISVVSVRQTGQSLLVPCRRSNHAGSCHCFDSVSLCTHASLGHDIAMWKRRSFQQDAALGMEQSSRECRPRKMMQGSRSGPEVFQRGMLCCVIML